MKETKSFFRRALLFGFFLVLVLATAQAQAGIVGYTSRTAFDAAVPGASVEGWDTFPDGAVFTNGSTVNGITYNASIGNALVRDGYAYTTAPNILVETTYDNFGPYDTMTFSFVTPIRAFGIDIDTFAQTDKAYQVTTNLGDVALSGYDPFPTLTTGQFVGFISDAAISSVTIALGPNPDLNNYNNFGLDTMRYQAVPLPPSVLLLGSGLLGLAGFRRFRKS
jgi:hypothetical protein